MAIPFRQPNEAKRRLEMFFLIVALCYVGLVARLVWLQAIKGEYYRREASDLREQKVTLPDRYVICIAEQP